MCGGPTDGFPLVKELADLSLGKALPRPSVNKSRKERKQETIEKKRNTIIVETSLCTMDTVRVPLLCGGRLTYPEYWTWISEPSPGDDSCAHTDN